MSVIAEIVARLIAAGTPPDVAAIAVTEAFAAGAACRNSTGIPVDESAERRRAYDRDRKRQQAEIHRKSAETPRNSKTALNLTSLLPKLPEEPSEEVKEEKKVRKRKSQLSAEWQPNENHFAAAERLKIPHQAVLEKAEDMRLWAKGSGAIKADWDATFHGFLRRDAKNLANGNGHGKVAANQPFRDALAALGRSVEADRRSQEVRPTPPRLLSHG